MVNERFIGLLVKELCDNLSDADREELDLLLRDNRECREQKEILKDYWEKDRVGYEANAAMFKKIIEKIKVAENGYSTEPEEAFPQYRSPRSISKTIWYSAAAVILLTIGVFAYKYIRNSGGPENAFVAHWLQTHTLPAKKSVLTLSDSTVVTLNSGTTIKYPEIFGDSIREIYLDGEAYFDVTKDPRHPFIIHAGKMNIRVLGTSFNIKSYQNESTSEATLIKGSIELTLNDRPSDRIILKPNEKLVVQNNAAIKKRVNAGAVPSVQDNAGKGTRYSLTNLTYFPTNAKVVVETSWVENKLVFSDKDFAQLSGQLERWYGVHIEFASESVKEYRFTGFFEKESLTQALDALKMIEPFKYKVTGSTVYIY